MISQTIYKMDATGTIREWCYEVVGDSWRTITGIQGGKTVTSGWTRCKAKSQDTDVEQASFEARAAMMHKLDREYYDNLEDAQSGKPAMFKPMLATDYGKLKKPLQFPVHVQPKLDGMRCILTKDGAVSRQNKSIWTIPHVEKALEPFFKEYPEAILDGEIYNHDLKNDFQKIMSLARKKEPTSEGIEKLQYHIYDVAGEREWNSRTQFLFDFILNKNLEGAIEQDCIHLCRTTHVADEKMLDHMHALFVEEGYEGSMIRLAGPYEHKRSKLLLKRKDFESEEFKILGVLEGQGNWAGFAKHLVLEDSEGREFNSGIRGNQTEMKKLLADAHLYDGGEATVRFFGRSNENIPRFPVAIDLHPRGRED